ncbi:hypothetical protein G9A89_005383 [Geosiphon pyriformis]|nr:hypothetical protein G9A89_005383 [Geosiphon pyriformis]
MDNITILSTGAQIYAKKRKRKREQPKEIVFDDAARKEFLTGFHKRKVERKAKAQEHARLLAKKEHAKIVKEAREARKKEVEERLKNLQSFIDKSNLLEGEEENNNNSNDIEDGVKDKEENDQLKKEYPSDEQKIEFRTRDTLTTVTIIEEFDIADTIS